MPEWTYNARCGVQIYNLSIGRQTSPTGELQASEKPYLKRRVDDAWGTISKVVLWSPHICAHLCMLTYTQTHTPAYECTTAHTCPPAYKSVTPHTCTHRKDLCISFKIKQMFINFQLAGDTYS